METSETTVKNLYINPSRLNSLICAEEKYIWKNLIRIEELKREKRREKEELLRRSLQNRQ